MERIDDGAFELLRDLRRRGFTLWVEGDALRIKAPELAGDSELRARIAASKVEIIQELKAEVLRGSDRSRPLPLSYAQERLWFDG